jgi:hypothetical protein
MKARLSTLVAASVVLLASLCGLAQNNPAQNQPTPSAERTGETTPKEGVGELPAKNGSTGKSSPLLTILLAILSPTAIVGMFAYKLNKTIAERTVTIEAQKLLLEINKQLVSEPALFAIYDAHPGRQDLLARDPRLPKKLEAIGYMHLNVFEIVFAVLPHGKSYKTWIEYFNDSLNRCSILQKNLDANLNIYHDDLKAAYKSWRDSRKPAPTSGTPPSAAATETLPTFPPT